MIENIRTSLPGLALTLPSQTSWGAMSVHVEPFKSTIGTDFLKERH